MPKYKNEIFFMGKKYLYKNYKTLAKRLNITEKQAQELIKKPNQQKYIVDSVGNVGKFNIADSNPLLLQSFDIKRINNKGLLRPTNITNKARFYSNIPIKRNLKLKIKIIFNDDYYKPDPIIHEFNIYTNSKNLDDEINKHIMNYYLMFADPATLQEKKEGIHILNTEIVSQFTNQSFQLINSKLRDVKPLTLFYENIDSNNYLDCVRDYLKKIWKKMSNKHIDKLGDKNGVSTDELFKLCYSKDIQMIAYDINGNVICKNSPKKKNKNFKSLFFIAHNNHLYPLKNKSLDKITHTNKDIILVDNADIKLKETLNDDLIEPTNIITATKENGFIRCFDIGKNTYLENNDFLKCFNILKKFGIEEKCHTQINIKNVINQIIPLYQYDENNNFININSFFPQSEKFLKGGYGYVNTDDIDNYKNIKCIDKNKCYSFSLSELPYLITTDIRCNKITKYTEEKQPEKIIDEYLYIIEINTSSILLPNNNIYSGYHLKYCKEEGLNFIITEELETQKKHNFYKKMITDIYEKIDNNDAKNMINVMIGKMEICKQTREFKKVDRICNEEESLTVDGYKRKINGTDYYIVENDKTKYNLFNEKPISIQIKDNSRVILYKKIKELGLNEKDIIKIKTDSITFNDNNNICKDLEIEPITLNGWKLEDAKLPNNNIYNINNSGLSFDLNNEYENQFSEFYNCYAGVGKTYHIINNLIPKLNDDYIVLTPSHSTLKDYKENKLNSSVIQTYSFNGKIPKENNIIIDEVGLCNRQAFNVIHKCFLSDKNVYAYGDFKQLIGVGETSTYSNYQYLNSTFNEHKELNTNHRNHFTIEYYNDIINGKLDNIQEINKHMEKDYKKADIIICYTNKTVDLYNNFMLKHYGFNDKFQKGVKLVCKTNDYRKLEIYNDFEFTITDVKNDILTLDNEYEFTKEQIKKDFKPAYARTIYGVQGKSYRSYHFAQEDNYYLNLSKYKNRIAYTVISRLKTK